MRQKFVTLLTMLIVGLALVACAATAPTPAPAGREVSATIESVEVRILESMPVQVQAQIRGFLSDGCTTLGAISQEREGNTITVSVMGNHSGAEVCPMIAPGLDETISLEGEFAPGQYTLIVNGFSTTFQV